MTRDEAREAGKLVGALESIKYTTKSVARRATNELVGIGCSVEHSDSGSTGCGHDALLPRDLAIKALAGVRTLIEARLVELGVTQ